MGPRHHVDESAAQLRLDEHLVALLHQGPSEAYQLLGPVEATQDVVQLVPLLEQDGVELIDDECRVDWLKLLFGHHRSGYVLKRAVAY